MLFVSSLRVRGAGVGRAAARAPFRVIPACAGSSLAGCEHLLACPCHPCVCGEQDLPVSLPMVGFVSSLRVRGAGCWRCKGTAILGVIPACAGSRVVPREGSHPLACHPCVCGEQHRYSGRSPNGVVSSLRVRGADRSAQLAWRWLRVIPACAGSSASAGTDSCAPTCHPCVCGEQVETGYAGGVEIVSSLRVRGAVVWTQPVNLHTRVIPACAGSSLPVAILVALPLCHPCVCGEQTV